MTGKTIAGASFTLLLSALRVLIVSNYEPTVAIAIAKEAGLGDTLLGTLAPLLPPLLPIFAGGFALLAVLAAMPDATPLEAAAAGGPVNEARPYVPKTLRPLAGGGAREDALRRGGTPPGSSTDSNSISEGAALGCLFLSYLAGAAALIVTPVTDPTLDDLNSLFGTWAELAVRLSGIALLGIAVLCVAIFIRSYWGVVSEHATTLRRLQGSPSTRTLASDIRRVVQYLREFAQARILRRAYRRAANFVGAGGEKIPVTLLVVAVLASFPGYFAYRSWALVEDFRPSTLRNVWLPSEVLRVKDRAPLVGYVLGDEGGWTSVLREEDRVVLRIKSENVYQRQLCSLQPSEPLPVLRLRSIRNSKLPRCPLSFPNVQSLVRTLREAGVECRNLVIVSGGKSHVGRCRSDTRLGRRSQNSRMLISIVPSSRTLRTGPVDRFAVVGRNWRVATSTHALAKETQAAIGGRLASQTSIPECNRLVYRPTSLLLACGDGNTFVKGLRWGVWQSRVAIATGFLHFNDCAPSCVNGTFHSRAVRLIFKSRRYCPDENQLIFGRLTKVYEKPLRGVESETVELDCPL